jgi:hypothetical protein
MVICKAFGVFDLELKKMKERENLQGVLEIGFSED